MVQQVQSVRTVIRGDADPFVRATRRASRALRNHRSAVRNTTRDYNQAEAATTRLSRGFGTLTSRLAAFASVSAGISLGASLVQAGLEIERLEQRFRFALEGIEEGAQGLQFVRQEADRLGISFVAAAQGYSGLAASARGTTIAAEEVREIFLGISEAAAVLRLDTDQTRRAFRALEQIISKGKVSAEELRGQLGENLPGAVQIMGRALGVTTLELDKFLEQGQLSADALVPFARQLRREFATGVPDAIDSAAASFNRLNNSIRQMQQSIAQSGLLEFIADVVDGARELGEITGAFERQGLLGIEEINRRLFLARSQIEEIGPDIGALRAALESDGNTFASTGFPRFYVEEVVERYDAALERLRELNNQRRQVLGLTFSDDARAARRSPVPEEDPLERALFQGAADQVSPEERARLAAEERANNQLLRLRQQYQDRAARVGLDAVGRVEQARIEALRRVEALEGQGGNEERAATARLAIETSTARQISQIRSNELVAALEESARLEEEAREEQARLEARALAERERQRIDAERRTLRLLEAEQSTRLAVLNIVQQEVQALRERGQQIQAQADAIQSDGAAPDADRSQAEFAQRLRAQLTAEQRRAELELTLAIERQNAVDNESTRDAVRNARFRVEALEGELGQVAATTQAYRQQFEELQRAAEELEEMRRLKSIADEVGGAIGQLAGAAVRNFDDIGDAARRAGLAIADLILQQTVVNPIGGLISGGIGDIVGSIFGNAIGGAAGASFTAPPPGIGPQFSARPVQQNTFHISGSDEATVRRAIAESAPQLADISVGRATQQLNQRSAFQQAVRRN